MLGWEFPPFISGGLGNACYGITTGLIKNGVQVLFVIPTRRGQQISQDIQVYGADEIPLLNPRVKTTFRRKGDAKRTLEWLEYSPELEISPYYTSPELMHSHQIDLTVPLSKTARNKYLAEGALLEFTGNYGKNLLSEVRKFELVAQSIGLLEKFDLIHAHDWFTYPAGVRARQVSGKPLIVHVHATEFDRSGENMNREVYNIEKYGMEQADKIIAVSFYTRNIITKYYGIDPAKIEVVHNAVNKDRQLERYSIKKNFDEKIVLFLGRVTMQKGPEYFLEAANIVLKKMDNVRFVMAGSGDMLPRMIVRMAQLRIADKFHFTGFLRGIQVEKMYALSDLYVMPSVSEPFGLTPFEALLYDVPIIISRQSGAAELLKNAIKLDFWDVDKLAATISNIIQSKEMANDIVERCQEEIKDIGWYNAGRRIKDIYQKLLKTDKV